MVVCRLCTDGNGKYYSICQSISRDIELTEMIKFSTGLKVNKYDGLSQLICENCIRTMIVSYDFIILSKSSDAKLRKLKKKSKNETVTSYSEYPTWTDRILSIKTDEDIVYGAEYLEDEIISIPPDLLQGNEKGTKDEFLPVEYLDCKMEKIEEVTQEDKVDEEEEEEEQQASDSDYSAETKPKTVKRSECCGCSASFPHRRQLKKHSKVVHEPHKDLNPPANRLECSICWKIFANYHEVDTTHKKYPSRIHVVNSPFIITCCGKNCDKTFDDRETLKEHALLEHIGDKEDVEEDDLINQYECEYCFRKYQTLEKMQKHQMYYAKRDYVLEKKSSRKKNKSTKEKENAESGVEDTTRDYLCCGCTASFNTQRRLKEHSQEVHEPVKDKNPPEERLECTICCKIFKSMYEVVSDELHKRLPRRIKNINSKLNILCCGTNCERSFDNREELREHAKHAHIDDRVEDSYNVGPIECDICFHRYPNIERMRAHQSYFSRINNLRNKKMNSSKEELINLQQTIREFRCCGCEEVLPTEIQLMSHSHLTHEPFRDFPDEGKPFECNICFRRFKNEMYLSEHKQSPYSQRHKCNVCDKVFPMRSSLRTHMKLHEDNKIICHICSKLLKNKQSLKVHLLIHDDESLKLSCEECGKMFRRKKNLDAHLITHSEDRKFKCSLCPKRFKAKTNMLLHIRSHKQIKPYKCAYCDKSYTYPSDKKRHEITVHTGVYPYSCSFCTKAYVRKSHCHQHEAVCTNRNGQ